MTVPSSAGLDDEAGNAAEPHRHHAKRALPNATWNLLRAFAMAGVGFLTTPILIRTFSDGDYAGWVLVSSVTSYLTITDIGLSSEVVRATASARAEGDPANGFDTVKAAMILQAAFTAAMVALLALVVVVFPRLFQSVPASSVGPARVALISLGLTSLVQMALNPLVGHLIGLERLDVGAKAAIVSRLGALAWIVTMADHGLATVSVGIGLLYAGFYAIGAAWVYRIEPTFRLRRPFHSPNPFRPVLSFARRRLVWFIGYFASITFDITIVGRWAFKDLVPFSLAVSLVTVGAMAFEAVAATLLPQIPGLRGDAMARWFGSFLRFLLALGAAVVLGLGGASVVAVPVWVGSIRSVAVLSFLFPLLAVTFVRLLLDGCTVFLVVRNEQRLCTWNHVVESAVKIPLGIVLVRHLGAIGIVWSGLAGALLGTGLVLVRALQTAAPQRRLGPEILRVAAYGSMVIGVLLALRAQDALTRIAVLSLAIAVVVFHLLLTGTLQELSIIGRRTSPSLDASSHEE